MKSIPLSILVVLCSTSVLAQTQKPASVGSDSSKRTPVGSRVFIALGGSYQVGQDFTDGAVKQVNVEEGRFTVTYTVKDAPVVEVAGGVTVWRRLGIGVGVSRLAVSTPAALTGTVPHPFFFSRPRSVSGEIGGLRREVLAVHVQAVGVFSIKPRLQAMVFGGPSIVQVKQGLATDFTYTDTYPYDIAAFQQAKTVSASDSAIGFNIGGDLAFYFSKQVGVGMTAQFSKATVHLAGAGAAQSVDVGGLRAGGGLRLRF